MIPKIRGAIGKDEQGVMQMKNLNPSHWGVVFGVGFLTSASLIQNVNAELVYEDSVQSGDSGQLSRVDERDTLRQTMSSAEKMQATLSDQSAASSVNQTAQFPPVPTAPVNSSPSNVVYVNSQSQSQSSSHQSQDSTEVQNMSRSELLRRERIRTEVKNEDLLQERLEELRLKDEQGRADQLIGGAHLPSSPQVVISSSPSNTMPQEQVIVSPVTDHPGQAASRPSSNRVEGQTQDQYSHSYGTTAMTSDFPEYSEDRTMVEVQPRFGLSDILGSLNGYYNVRPRFSTGISLGVASSENVSFDVGYTYSEFGVVMGNYNPYIYYVANPYMVPQRSETIAMKQNLVDVGMKLHLLSSSSRIRPFLGGGAGYSFSYINYDQNLLNQNPYLRQWLGQDYEVKSFLGFLSGGVDVRVSRGVSLGVVGKYYNVLTSREQGFINNALLWGGYSVAGSSDAEKQYVGGTLARTNFYTLMGSVSFNF